MLRRISLYFYLYLSLILIPVFLSGNRALPASPADISNWKLPLPPGEYQITQGDADDPMCSSHCNRGDPWLGCAIDIAASDGTLVLAPASGTVLFSSPDRGDGAGNYITIQHDNGLVTQYQHLKTRFVVEKDRVTQGQPIGRVDSTGRSNGPHLHFGIFTDSTYAQCVKITELDGNTSFRKNDRIISHNAQQGNAPEDVPSVPVTPHPTVSSQSVTPPASSDLADPVIENFLRSQNSPLTDYVPVFIAAGRYYNVDPRFVVAISNAESSLGKNGRCATERHNAWGYGGGWPSCWNFSGWSDAIWQVTSDIGKFYFERYHQTNIPSFVISPAGTCQSHCWCASGCTNWIKLVGDAYETMGGDRNTNDLSFSAYSNSSPITPVPSPAGQPILVSPANGSSWPKSTEITLVWNAVSNATQYKVELWGGPYDRMTPCNWQNATSCRIGTMWPGTMYWRVKARNASGQESEWSETWSFTIQEIQPTAPPAPSRPTLLSPANGSSWPQSTEITLVWNTVSNATQYKVELWGGPYDRMTPCNWQSATSCRIGTMWPGTMYWRVKARNASGQESEWSETWSFTIQEIQPTAPPFTGNIAPLANRSPDGIGSNNAFDGNLSTFWVDGLGHAFTLTLTLPGAFDVSRILVWDRPQNSPDNQQINKLIITLSNGWSKRFDMVSGGPRCIDVTLSSPQTITSVTLKADDASGNNGLSEVEIWVGPKTGGPSCSNKGTMP
jgi:hypothetical protein